MSRPQRIYLDNAATSFPKPSAVLTAVDRALREVGSAAGRSATGSAIQVDRVLQLCRERAARLLGAERPDRIVFTANATDSLNLALHGLLRPGDHVVTSTIEHNSVLRPLRHLRERGLEVTYVSADPQGRVDLDDIRAALRKNTRLVTILHASNVTGTIQRIDRIGEIARSVGAFVLVDAAQTAGHLPIDLSRLPVDLLACAGHKGLLGPLGTGILYIRAGMEEHLESVRQGGTGSNSEDDHQPSQLPDKYECGNHNVPGLFGLEAALAWLEERGVSDICRHERALLARLLDALDGLPRLTAFGPKGIEERVAVVSATIDGFEPQELAAVLDESFGIETRAGLHCAPGAHRCIGTFVSGGTIRLSPGAFTTEAEIDAAAGALRELAGA